jgi:hypothetical protein
VLEHALVERAGVDPGGEVGEILERAVRFAFLDDLLRGLFADALDASEAEPDGRDAAIRS